MLRKIFLSIVLILFFWILYFGLKPKNYFLIFHPKQLTPVSPIYYIKSIREKLQSLLIMGDRDTTEWNFTLAKKRAQESHILCQNDLLDLGQKHLIKAQKHYQIANQYLDILIDKIDTNFLVQERDLTLNLINTTCK